MFNKNINANSNVVGIVEMPMVSTQECMATMAGQCATYAGCASINHC